MKGQNETVSDMKDPAHGNMFPHNDLILPFRLRFSFSLSFSLSLRVSLRFFCMADILMNQTSCGRLSLSTSPLHTTSSDTKYTSLYFDGKITQRGTTLC